MNVIVCLDDNNGMLFNNRRLSRDKNIFCDIKRLAGDGRIYANSFSFLLLKEYNINALIDDNFLYIAGEDDYCFVENCGLRTFADKINQFVTYRWNRSYPSDFKLDLQLSDSIWKLKSVDEFKGFSHEKITREIFIK